MPVKLDEFKAADPKARAEEFAADTIRLIWRRPDRIPDGKEVITMRYSKPKLVPLGTAIETIHSSLTKESVPIDSTMGPEFQTSSAAYQADE
jgi:hypothetical protein